MQIYEEATASTPLRDPKAVSFPNSVTKSSLRGGSALKPYNRQQTPMQSFRRSLKKDGGSTAKKTRFQEPAMEEKENHQHSVSVKTSTTPNSAQRLRRSLRASISQRQPQQPLGGGTRLGGGSLLGPPQRVLPKTPNSLLRTELGEDDSFLEDESLLVSPPPGALWNMLDTSSTGLVVVSPQAAVQIQERFSTAKKKQQSQQKSRLDDSSIFSPPAMTASEPTPIQRGATNTRGSVRRTRTSSAGMIQYMTLRPSWP